VARAEAAEVLDAIEEALDRVALPVDPGAEGEAILADDAGRDVRLRAPLSDRSADGVGVLGAVGDQRGAGHNEGQHLLGRWRITSPARQ
jgi:hypothetical protein